MEPSLSHTRERKITTFAKINTHGKTAHEETGWNSLVRQASVSREVAVGIVREVPRLQVDAQEVAHAAEGVRLRRRLPAAHAVALSREAHQLERRSAGVAGRPRRPRRLDECTRLGKGLGLRVG